MTNENNGNGTKAQSNRQRFRKNKEQIKKKNCRKPIRLVPIWVRIILITVIFAASLIAGAMFGYGVVGDGEPSDIINKETWQKIYDIVYKEID